METINNSQFIIIGKYKISKMILMSEPCQLNVTNSETNLSKLYRSDEVFKLLKKEGLDAEPLHEYFDEINGTTKEERIEILRMFEEWEEARKEDKKQLNRLEKWEESMKEDRKLDRLERREERKQMSKEDKY
jgi:hypothetical protein